MNKNTSPLKVVLQTVIDKAKSLANIRAAVKAFETALPKIKTDVDTETAVKKVKKLGKQKTNMVIQTKVDNSQIAPAIKEAQKETQTLWQRFSEGLAGINLIQLGLQKVVQSIRQAVAGIKELDTVKTAIQMAAGASDYKADIMISDYNSIAKELSLTTKDVAKTASELLRMGESTASINDLIKSSQVLSKVGMIDRSDAAGYLISSLNGYQLEAENAIDIVDKLASVDQKAAVSAGGLAESLSRCADIANYSGTSIDRLIGYTAVMGEATKESMTVIGDALQSIYSRMNNIAIGNLLDEETGESLADAESALSELGIQLQNTAGSYRQFDDVLDDMGSRWNRLTQEEQNSLAAAVAGSAQREHFTALMNHYSQALEYSAAAADSAGAAAERYSVYQDSMEAKTNELTAALESLSTNILSKELYGEMIAAASSIVELIDKSNLLKSTLAGIVTMGISKTFVSISASIIHASRSAAQFTAVMKLFDNERSENNLTKIGRACKGLSEKQLKLVLSTKDLNNQQRLQILSGMKLEEQERQQMLATLGFANAEKTATGATFSFKGALNMLSAAFAANPIGVIVGAVSTLISLFTMASSVASLFSQSTEENRRKAAELSEEYKQQQSTLDSQVKKYKELRESLDNVNLSIDEARSVKEQLLEVQNSLVETYGDEAGNIDLVNGKYKEQLHLLDQLSKEQAEDFIIENRHSFEKAKKALGKVEEYNLGEITNWSSIYPISDNQQALLDYIKSYSELFEISETYTASRGYSYETRKLNFHATAKVADKLMRQFAKDLKEYGEKNNIDVSNILLKISEQLQKTQTDELKENKKTYDEFIKAQIISSDTFRPLFQQSLQAVEDYNKALSSGEGIAEAKAALNSAKLMFHFSIGKPEGAQEVFDDIYERVNRSAEAAFQLNEAFQNDGNVQKYAEQLRGLSDINIKAINLDNDHMEQGEEAFRKLLDTLGYTDPAQQQIQSVIDKLVELEIITGKDKTAEKPYEIFSSFAGTEFGARIQHITELFNEGALSHKDYFEALQAEIDGFDPSGFTDSLEDMNKASAQFFADSVQQTAEGLSSLINSFDKGEMSISEYLEGYLAVGSTLSALTDSLQENSSAWNEQGEAVSEAGNAALDDAQSRLSLAMSTIESYQDSIYSLEQLMSGAVTAGSDEFTAHANVIAEDLYHIVEAGGAMADAIADTLGTTTGEIAQSLTDNVSNQEIACQAIAANTNLAITDMASSMGELFDDLGSAISNFKVDVSFGVKSIDWKKVNVFGAEISLPEIKFELGASGESLEKIGSTISAFGKSVASSYKPQTIDLEDFHFGSTENAKDKKYAPGPRITQNYNKALEQQKKSEQQENGPESSRSSKPDASSAQTQFSETLDFFERRVKALDNALSLLKSASDNVSGAFAKNTLADAQLSVTEEKMKNYAEAMAMYSQKADEALAKLPADTAALVKSGAVALTDFVGDENKNVVEAIKEYESWAGKVTDCRQELEELQGALRQLELEKFNQIMDDFNDQFSLRDKGKSLISRQMDLLKEAGELTGSAFYAAQIDQSKKQLALLEEEKAQLAQQAASALGSGRIRKGTEEWLEMAGALADVEGNILDCKKTIEELDNSLLNLHTEVFDRIQKQFSDIDSEISRLAGLFEDFDPADDKGGWTGDGMARLGLLVQQYELAQYQIQQYNNEIDELKARYLEGRYSASEYADRLADLSSAQWDAVNASQSARDAIMDLNEARIDGAVKGIEKEIDSYKELTDARLEALRASRDLHDYENSMAEKTKSVTDLERRLAAMQHDTSAAAAAKRRQLEEELAEARKALEEAEYDHSLKTQEEALNSQYESYEEERRKEIEGLRESLNEKETILGESFETVKNNAALIGWEIANMAALQGAAVSETLISSWQSGETAVAAYGETLSQNTSAFIGSLMGVEAQVWSLQARADNTASSLAWMFAARADSLVNELGASYYAESNLAGMTNTLQQVLSNTLERGYNVNGILSSLGSIASAANAAAKAVEGIGTGNRTGLTGTDPAGGGLDGYEEKIKKISAGGGGGTGGLHSQNLKPTSRAMLHAYAGGTRATEGDLIVTDEEGEELKLPRLESGQYTIAREGTQVLTKHQTDNLFQWSGFSPQELAKLCPPVNLPESVLYPKLPEWSGPSEELLNKLMNQQPVTVHYDSLVTVNGDVNDTNHFTKQVAKIARQEIDKDWQTLNDTVRYRSI